MYSSERLKNIVKKDVRFLAAGIHDNVKLASARFDVSPNGNQFIEIKFEKEDVDVILPVTGTEYEPRHIEGEAEDAYQLKCDKQFSRIEQILKCFYPNAEDRVFTGDNFKQFGEWVVEKLNNADKSILVRLKVIYNDNGYATLPRYAKYTFIEPMSVVNEGKSVIVKLGIDNFERPVKADNEVSNANPFETVNAEITATVTTEGEDLKPTSDLPF